MKQLFHFLFVLVIVLCATVLVLIALSTLLAPKDPVLDALPRWESKEFYTSGGFQDSADYAKYTYRIGKDQLEETGGSSSCEGRQYPGHTGLCGKLRKMGQDLR